MLKILAILIVLTSGAALAPLAWDGGGAAVGSPDRPAEPAVTRLAECTPCHRCANPTPDDPCLRACPRDSAALTVSTEVAPLEASPAGPPDVVILGELEDVYLPVPFDHRGHADMAAMGEGCAACHHHTPAGAESTACKACHGTLHNGEDALMPGLKGAYHRQCLGCHRDWSHSTACSACHIPKTRAAGGADVADVAAAQPVDLGAGIHASISAQGAFVYAGGLEPASRVTFHHADHAGTYGLSCTDCHHDESCSGCHGQRVARQTPDFHQSCGTCHDRRDCGFCHKAEVQPASFDHARVAGWSLGPAHAGLDCATCHGPASSFARPTRDCRSCHHRLHTGGFDHRATSDVGQCIACHADVVAAGAGGCPHEAMEGGCNACHDTARAELAPYLRDKPPALCLSCHTEVDRCLRSATVVHGSALGARGCTNCHAPHGAPRASLLRRATGELCLGCHDRRIEGSDGRMLTNIAARLAECPNPHGPVRDGECGACHQPHAGDRHHLLQADFPGRFYCAFDVDAYALCFSCHDEELVEAEPAGTLTGFRDGDQNLHRLHVNREKGRTCLACHDVHASKGSFHIREAVPFDGGDWTFLMRYEQTPDGGHCSPACHQAREYRRSGRITALAPVPAGGQPLLLGGAEPSP